MSELQRAAAVEVTDVTKRYGDVWALDGVSLSIAPGEYVAISGPSGCGKSTLLHLVAALDRPTSGRVEVEGRDVSAIHDISKFRRDEVGLVFQLHNLLPRISVLANVEVVMYGTHRNTRARRERALELLGQVDLLGRERRMPTQLSGGERQRVAIARALANNPRLLLADEPTGNLDADSVDRVMELFRNVNNSGVTIVLVTHDESLALTADRIISIRAGKVVEGSTSFPGRRGSHQPDRASG
ncbi:MAG TPA: ABC transporter ATP-binding protein [Acidimicrobiales bacterium]|nr:ABC transporter ATP-binding protein [Acidimicrobiales bacterium]